MYKIKQLPEDFIVKEISNIKIGNSGDYSYFLLKKKNYTTLRAVEQIANKLNIPLKWVGFAGNKDKNAVTEQLISIKNTKIKNLKLKDIELEHIGNNNSPISLGDLEGNYFEITIRNLTKKGIEKIKDRKLAFPNYFGEQRFSKNNAAIGRSIIKKDFKKAVELAAENDKEFSEKVNSYLKDHKNDYIGALRKIPLKLRRIYVHSYQSFLFNETVDRYLKLNKTELLHFIYKKLVWLMSKTQKFSKKNIKILIIGFGAEVKNNQIKKIIDKLLKKEKINFRDFIIKQMPELSSEGGERNLFEAAKEFKIISVEDDELSKNKKKAIISFKLSKGTYATVFVKNIFNPNKNL